GDLVLLVAGQLAGDLVGAVLDGGGGHLVGGDLVAELREGQLGGLVALAEPLGREEDGEDTEEYVDEGGAGGSLHSASRLPVPLGQEHLRRQSDTRVSPILDEG